MNTNIKLPVAAQKVIAFFQKNGFECFVVGGYVRDELLKQVQSAKIPVSSDFGRRPESSKGGSHMNEKLGIEQIALTNALDFATNATPEQMLKILPEGKYENKFGTVFFSLSAIARHIKLRTNEAPRVDTRGISVNGGAEIPPKQEHSSPTLKSGSPAKEDEYHENDYVEITTYRSEKDYSDFRHPNTVNWGTTIEEDLKRRDFTINALATDGKNFIDLFGGQKDIEHKIIRAIGDPDKRFHEDALRLMRAVRFAAELGFIIEEKTMWSIAKNAPLLKNISFERIRDEFLKILSSNYPVEGIQVLKNTELLRAFLPELYDCFGVGQVSPKRHHIYDVGTHLLKTLAAVIPLNRSPIVRLACLLHDIAKPKTRNVLPDDVVTFYNHEIIGTEMVYEIARRLRLSKKDLTKLTTLVRYHQFVVTENQTDNALRRFIREIGLDNLQDMLDLRVADRIGSGSKPSSWRLELFKKRLEEVQRKPFTVRDLKIKGEHIMKLFNIKPSREVGNILNDVFEQVSQGKLKNEKKELLEYLNNKNKV